MSVPNKINLLAWWSMDEESGVRADSHGSNNLSDNNSVTFTAGVKGNAAKFTNATSEYLDIADNADLSFGDDPMTLVTWVVLDNKTTEQGLVAKYTSGSDDREWSLRYKQADDEFNFFVSSDGLGGTVVQVNASTLGSPSIATRYFIAARHDPIANTISIQINGGVTDSQATAAGIFDGVADMRVGSYDGAAYLDGNIDETSLWGAVLTDADLDFLYNGGTGRTYSELQPSPAALTINAIVPTPTIATFDTRVKLNALPRTLKLTTQIRNDQ